jgi:alanine racemase
VAATAGTIGYELMCALAPRVPVRQGELIQRKGAF